MGVSIVLAKGVANLTRLFSFSRGLFRLLGGGRLPWSLNVCLTLYLEDIFIILPSNFVRFTLAGTVKLDLKLYWSNDIPYKGVLLNTLLKLLYHKSLVEEVSSKQT